MFRLSILIFTLLSLSCNCQKNATESSVLKNNQETFTISEIYYQSWVAGVRGGGSGINIHIVFKDNLPNYVQLKKIQLLHYTTDTIDVVENLKYIGRIKTERNQLKLEEDPINEYGNEVPIKLENSLKEGQVLLTFENDGKEFTQLIENVKQVEMLAYPSTKPRN